MGCSGKLAHIRLLTSCNNAPKHMRTFPDSVEVAEWQLSVCCNGIDGAGLGASKNGLC